jgi:hypothetical protein
MIAIVPIALAAGCASALMFASITSGALISLVLLYLAPLPLMVATMTWGPLCGSIGGIAASLSLGAIFGLPHCIGFAITVALPAWWLAHLALLGRPLAAAAPTGEALPDQSELEWYPIGRILLWIAGFATFATMATLLTLGTDSASITSTLREFLLSVLKMQGDVEISGETERIIGRIISLAPAAAAVMATTTLSLNLWLAAKITATSGRLLRPWPDLRSVALPPLALAVLCVAVAFCFGGGLPAIAARIAASALMIVYTFVGFAVLHTLTLALKNRTFWLGSIYTVVVLFVWPVLALMALGVADSAFGLRRRFLRRRPPPLPAP